MGKIQMIEEAIRLKLGVLSDHGGLLVQTGMKTGRSTKERFLVDRPDIHDSVDWGKINQSFDASQADSLFQKAGEFFGSISSFQYEGFVGGYPIEVFSTSPWHIAFCENMFRKKVAGPALDLLKSRKQIRVYHRPFTKASEWIPSYPDDTMILLDPSRMRVLIVGTAYAGEIKKSAFTLCNFDLVDVDFLPMHASANCLEDGSESCVLFGLSGTGKTTLSASPDRFLIGDDEIVWTPNGISNLEGGCYAKLINLSKEREPEIFSATNRFGAIMENVAYDRESGQVDFDNGVRTENTRGSYPLHHLKKVFDQTCEAEAPKTIVFLTADAFGAMPAVACLNSDQAQYHFMSGYTAKVSGTEIGVTEPQAAFSACFGAPFMPRPAAQYASLLTRLAKQNQGNFWLLNTGWMGGGYGKGSRFPLEVSRRILFAIQSGLLAQQGRVRHPVFGFEVPTRCPGVDPKYLEIPTGPQVDFLAGKFLDHMKGFGGLSADLLERGGPAPHDSRRVAP